MRRRCCGRDMRSSMTRVDATELDRGLRVKCMEGLVSRRADQRDQSGYEEAACQGIMAGINAALWREGRAGRSRWIGRKGTRAS